MSENLDVSDLSNGDHDMSTSLGDAKIHKLARDYQTHLKKLPTFRHKSNVVKQSLLESATTIGSEKFVALNQQYSKLQNEIENFEFQLEEAVDLELDDNVWDGQIIPKAEMSLEDFVKFELVVDNIAQLDKASKTEYQKVDNSSHRLEIGNSHKHRVGGWNPDTTGINQYMAYGLFRNGRAVQEKSRVTSTSLVIIKDDNDQIISFDVERDFEYTWGFGRQKGRVLFLQKWCLVIYHIYNHTIMFSQ